MNLIGWLIVICEIAFWLVILTGLCSRYVFRRPKLGLFFLALTPVIDLFLLVFTSVDLYKGATATVAHALAAVYIGVSIAFGKSMITWADDRFRYYFLKEGAKPIKRHGTEYAHHYFKGWIRHFIAYLIGSGIMITLIYIIDDSARTLALQELLKVWSVILGIDFLITVSNYIWPKKAKNVAGMDVK
ncbi:hypothetical protein [Bacillus mesophilus]|uniref:Membrane protein YmcC n=1 Tax=Bacillus mesophilus TaxID=1808955 RepID=A0A6M0QAW4_9BACI|nr:hypothetical protein [Bacillus mesophilus]